MTTQAIVRLCECDDVLPNMTLQLSVVLPRFARTDARS
jgi:hypothetical protein